MPPSSLAWVSSGGVSACRASGGGMTASSLVFPSLMRISRSWDLEGLSHPTLQSRGAAWNPANEARSPRVLHGPGGSRLTWLGPRACKHNLTTKALWKEDLHFPVPGQLKAHP